MGAGQSMSIIFGIQRSTGAPVTNQELFRLASATEAFALDGSFVASGHQVGMGFQPFHTTLGSRQDSQPASDIHQNMLVFDGRLDNRSELLAALDIDDTQPKDSVVILAGFNRWRDSVFFRLIGEWALALWSEKTQTLYLARDHAGTRTLYFRITNGHLRWSTYLETFFVEGDIPPLDEEYASAFLCGGPIGDRTPYSGICAVPPAHYLVIQGRKVTKHRYWSALVEDEIRYRTDLEYEEHFFTLFQQAVARRTAIGDPVLAQLSGGMDSTSIVCMSDHILRSQGYSVRDLLNTISYVSPSEPHWDEEPFIAATEAQRGKAGIHLDVHFSEGLADPAPPELGEQLLPGVTASWADFQERIRTSLGSEEYRAILSGIGGDEILGGVPTPGPELADYLSRFEFSRLFRKGLAWSIALRDPLPHMLLGTAGFTLGLYWPQVHCTPPAPPWLAHRLRNLSTEAGSEDLNLFTRLQARPSALNNARTWLSMQETLPNRWPAPGMRYEYRYPYLDRDLVEFLFRVPREQIVQPGRRRSLMRRSLQHLLPVEILERRRKAFVSRGPLVALQAARSRIEALFENPVLAELGWVNAATLRRSSEPILNGRESAGWPQLMRAITLELWLQSRHGDLRAGQRALSKHQVLFENPEQPSSVQTGP
jgi:asparagine synthase (glutamine-hydrolysing)